MTTYRGSPALGTCHTRLSVDHIKDQTEDNLPEWSSLQGTRGGWVGGRKQTKGKRAVKLFEPNQRANLCGNETNAYAQGDHVLANRKFPSNYDY